MGQKACKSFGTEALVVNEITVMVAIVVEEEEAVVVVVIVRT